MPACLKIADRFFLLTADEDRPRLQDGGPPVVSFHSTIDGNHHVFVRWGCCRVDLSHVSKLAAIHDVEDLLRDQLKPGVRHFYELYPERDSELFMEVG